MLTVQENDTVSYVRDLIVEESIKGLPVVDAENRLKGLVTQSDLFQIWDLMERGWIQEAQFTNDTEISKIMVKKVVTVQKDDSLEEVSKEMVENAVHRVIVMDVDRVVGVISTLDLLKILTRSGELAYRLAD